jgi:predicted phage tail protein
MSRLIQGSGGGGGGKGGGGSSRPPVESPDTLHSSQFARVVDLISEGEIEGLVDGLRSVYLNETPMLDAQGRANFAGLTVAWRNGTQAQAHISGFSAVENEVSVGARVERATPIVRTISNTNINAARVTVSVPALTFQDVTTGDLGGTSVAIRIERNNNNAGWQVVREDVISGKTTSRYQRSYRIELPSPGPWQIRVTRLTADSTKSNLQNATWWDSYTEIIDAKLRYPNSAIVGVQVSAEQFNAIPTRGYLIRGLRIKVPNNYDPITREYAGAWDGSFKIAWTNNPAWIFYDLVTADRYGLGEFIAEDAVDKWALYEIARYCDELVPDGFGGFEPRFTCNMYLQTREQAYSVINSLASIFRGLVYWSKGQITAVQDKPADVVAQFTAANVIDGAFSYQGSSGKARHTVALVGWNDPADFYRQKIEYVEDPDGIARYGVIQTELFAIGCTSRGQAHRLGRWLLYSERLETETISFRAGLDAALVYPGAIIRTTDSTRAGARMGGRLVSATLTALTLDAPVSYASGQHYEATVVLPDGTLATRRVEAWAGEATELTLLESLPDTPKASAIWVLSATNLIPETWRVVAISQAEPGVVEISALAYRPDKYAAVEQNLILEPLPTSIVGTSTPPVTNLSLVESLYLVTPTLVGNAATLSWTSDQPYFFVTWRRTDQPEQYQEVTQPSITINGIEPGVYEFSVQAVNALGRRSAAVTLTREIYGLSLPPANVTGLTMAAIAGSAHFAFNPAPDLDVQIGGHMRMRHTASLESADWNRGIDIGSYIPGNASSAVLPLLAGTYMAKWVDSSGFESPEIAAVITSAPSIINLNFVELLEEDPSFAGSRDHVYVASFGAGTALLLDSELTVDQMLQPVDEWPSLGLLGGTALRGEYGFASSVDLGRVHTSRLSGELVATGYNTDSSVDLWADVDSQTSVDGESITDAKASLEMRITQEDPALALWSSWGAFTVGDWTARAFEFRLVLTRNQPTHNVAVTRCAVEVDMPDRIQSGENLPADAAPYTVVFADPFYVRPALGITAEQMQSGDYYEITDKSQTGFTVTFRNAAGSPVARTFDYIARGY